MNENSQQGIVSRQTVRTEHGTQLGPHARAQPDSHPHQQVGNDTLLVAFVLIVQTRQSVPPGVSESQKLGMKARLLDALTAQKHAGEPEARGGIRRA